MKYIKMNPGKTAAGHPVHGVMSPGFVYELEDKEARAFIKGGYAVEVEGPAEAVDVDQIEQAEIAAAEAAETKAKEDAEIAAKVAVEMGNSEDPAEGTEAQSDAEASDQAAEDMAVALTEDTGEADAEEKPQRPQRRRTS